ncbi:LysE family translocator [Falsiroseomonas tokyonensis]|uniref:LysE family translocator n=1 Tax=Falsiroseomonas tokyonensis TaxID=430521 RepID=A0ABV7BQJ8_9PROT|nr:LysE family translocator [Falsiroseomonas tokyonensis]MBU8536939.1 LysE family translocator [Falsiroseomonas tokyonensis]
MEPAALLLFAASYLAVLVLPGPSVTALIARVLAQGLGGAPAFVAGVVVAALVWFTLAATGLALLAASLGGVFEVIRYAGAAYLLFLAWKMWRAPVRPLAAPPPVADAGRMFLAGLAVNLGNPKAMMFFFALLPTVVDLGGLTLLGFVELALVIVLVCGGVLGGYALAAARARRLFTSPCAMRWMNRGGATVMAGTAATIAAR